jgi:hypothetical protein
MFVMVVRSPLDVDGGSQSILHSKNNGKEVREGAPTLGGNKKRAKKDSPPLSPTFHIFHRHRPC